VRHRRLRVTKFYTPGLQCPWHLGGHVMTAVEVKLEWYEVIAMTCNASLSESPRESRRLFG